MYLNAAAALSHARAMEDPRELAGDAPEAHDEAAAAGGDPAIQRAAGRAHALAAGDPRGFAEAVVEMHEEANVPEDDLPALEDLQALHRAVARARARAPRTRTWEAAELRAAATFLEGAGFRGVSVFELNTLLPPGARNPDGAPPPAANVLVWRDGASQMGIDMDALYAELEALELDTVKWSRRAKPGTDGLQQKRARHNCCFTDLEEPLPAAPAPGDVVPGRHVRHPHPKNPRIKFTNYSFAAVPELARFRERLAAALGPFGHKVVRQFAELNKYYRPRACGIGRHGDTERGGERGPGAVNCLKVGAPLPLLFSWYHRARPVGRGDVPPAADADPRAAAAALVTVPKKGTTTAAAVMTLAHGDVYFMSAEAIGYQWRRSSIHTLRHAAGAAKYTDLPAGYYAAAAEAYAAVAARYPCAYSLTFSDVVENDSESPELRFATPFLA
jgi:hypothetical protein